MLGWDLAILVGPLVAQYTGGMDAPEKRRWYCPTPAWLVLGSLAVEGLLWLSERYTWFWFNEKKGWTVLIAVAERGRRAGGDAAVVACRAGLSIEVPVRHPHVAGLGRGRGGAVQLDGCRDEAGEGPETGNERH